MLLSTLIPLLPLAYATPFWLNGRVANAGHAGGAAVGHARRHTHPAQLAHMPEEREIITFDERGLPITTTTTMWHVVTQTETVWVDATGRPDEGSTSVTESGSGVATGISSITASPTASASVDRVSLSDSAQSSRVSATHSASPSLIASASDSLVVESAGPSPSPSPSRPALMSGHSSLVPSATQHYSSSVAEESNVAVESATASAASQSSHSYSHSRSVSAASGHATASAADSASETASITEQAVSSSSASVESSSALSVIESASISASRPAHASHSASLSSTVIASISPSPSAATSPSASPDASPSPSPEPSPSPSASTTSVTAASAIPSPSSSSSAALQPLPRTLMAGYYPDWSGWYLSPEQVDWSRFDIMDFAFALPTSSGGLEFTQWDSSDLLHRLATAAHAAGKRVKLSIGGWTGSQYFSTICQDAGLRATFVKSIADAYATYNLDGIDIDWEYPNAQGATGNAVSSSDSANYLQMLQQLRAALPDGAIITLATQVWPFAGSDGSPMSDVSGFAAVIDYILIMNYDIWGCPNAPLSDACGNSTQPLANAYAAISSWTQAGMPADQITLGVPAYGYLSASWNDQLRQRSLPFEEENALSSRSIEEQFAMNGHGYPLDGSGQLPGQGRDQMYGIKQRGKRSNANSLEKRYVTVSSGWSTSEGQVMWHDLVTQGALVMGSNGKWVGGGGFERKWDACSSTIVTYDDPDSMSLKAQFAKQAGLRGCNVFSIDGDYTNGGWPLTDAVRSGLGL